MQIAFVIALVFAIGIALFAVQNTTPVAVNFLFFQAQQVAVSVLVLITTLIGAALTLLIGIGRELRRTMALRSLRSELAAKERRIQELEAQLPPAPAAAPESAPAVAAAPEARTS